MQTIVLVHVLTLISCFSLIAMDRENAPGSAYMIFDLEISQNKSPSETIRGYIATRDLEAFNNERALAAFKTLSSFDIRGLLMYAKKQKSMLDMAENLANHGELVWRQFPLTFAEIQEAGKIQYDKQRQDQPEATMSQEIRFAGHIPASHYACQYLAHEAQLIKGSLSIRDKTILFLVNNQFCLAGNDDYKTCMEQIEAVVQKKIENNGEGHACLKGANLFESFLKKVTRQERTKVQVMIAAMEYAQSTSELEFL